MKRCICILALFFGAIKLSAQGDFRPGFIITNSNDSISGLVKYTIRKGAAASCEFRRSKGGKTEIFRPGEIRSYGFFGNKRFVSKQVEEDGRKVELFLDVLVSGKLSLLRSHEYFYIEGDSLVRLLPENRKSVQTTHGEMIRTAKPYQGQLNYVFRDCRLSAENTRYEETSLAAIVQNYNLCKGAAGLTYKEQMPVTRVGYSVFTGVHGSQLGVERKYKNGFGRDWSPLIGAGLNLSAPRVFDKVFFIMEGFYTQKKYVGTIVGKRQVWTESSRLRIEFPALQISIGVRYNLRKEGNTPYGKLAFGQYLNLNGSVNTITDREAFGQVITETSSSGYNPNNQSSIVASIGYQINLYRGANAFAEFRYEKAAGFTGSGIPGVVTAVDNIGVWAGIMF